MEKRRLINTQDDLFKEINTQMQDISHILFSILRPFYDIEEEEKQKPNKKTGALNISASQITTMKNETKNSTQRTKEIAGSIGTLMNLFISPKLENLLPRSETEKKLFNHLMDNFIISAPTDAPNPSIGIMILLSAYLGEIIDVLNDTYQSSSSEKSYHGQRDTKKLIINSIIAMRIRLKQKTNVEFRSPLSEERKKAIKTILYASENELNHINSIDIIMSYLICHLAITVDLKVIAIELRTLNLISF